MASPFQELLDILKISVQENQFYKLLLVSRRDLNSTLLKVNIRPVMIKAELKLSFVNVYATKEITKNYDLESGIRLIAELLESDFRMAELSYRREKLIMNLDKKNKLRISRQPLSSEVSLNLDHDRTKKRFISTQNNIYLSELGITNTYGSINRNKEDKFRQIDKYIEILDSIIREAGLQQPISIADMGCGKGYLTFALYDYLSNTLKLKTEITGVESRKELVEETNAIAVKAGFGNLQFKTGNIVETEILKTDVLIALHACDTATDDAIYRGIQQHASIIICAPCCHKQIRKQMDPANVLNRITQYGILADRQAELITDTIRAMIMEAYGYKTKVFEFISSEHTPKNLLITGIKKKDVSAPDQSILGEVEELKKTFNIQYHYLEKLLGLNQVPQ